jgi:hypothetical protein
MGPIAAAIFREPLDQMRQRPITKAPLYALYHQIRNHFSGDPANVGTPAHDFPIAGIESKGHANDLPVPAGDLQSVGGPAKVRPDRYDLAFMSLATRQKNASGLKSIREHAPLRNYGDRTRPDNYALRHDRA